MSLINLSIKHGRTLDEARQRLQLTVDEISRMPKVVQRVDWNADRTQAKLVGTGFNAELRIDAESVHLEADIPLLGKLLGSPITAQLKDLLERNFAKRIK